MLSFHCYHETYKNGTYHERNNDSTIICCWKLKYTNNTSIKKKKVRNN